MDLLAFHSSDEIREEIKFHLSELGFEFEVFSLLSVDEIKKLAREKKPVIVLMEVSRRTLETFVELSTITFAIPIIKSIDREIAINLEEMQTDYLLSDSIYSFKESFMQILIKNEEKIKDFVEQDRVFRNLIYGFGFSWGRTYIVNVGQKGEVVKLIPKFSRKIPIFMAMRENPSRFMNMNNLKVFWVTDVVGKNRIKPHNLTILTDNIIKFIESGKKRIVIMDCIEYLLLYNDFVNVLRNVELINSYAMDYESLVIIIIDNNSYTNKEYSLLKRYSMVWKGA